MNKTTYIVMSRDQNAERSHRIRTDNRVKDRAISIQASTGPEGSRRLRLPDFKIIGI